MENELKYIKLRSDGEEQVYNKPADFIDLLKTDKNDNKISVSIALLDLGNDNNIWFGYENGVEKSISDIINLHYMVGGLPTLKMLDFKFGGCTFFLEKIISRIDNSETFSLIIKYEE